MTLPSPEQDVPVAFTNVKHPKGSGQGQPKCQLQLFDPVKEITMVP
jgi:hypothetical protein